jgi:hypothetical protein
LPPVEIGIVGELGMFFVVIGQFLNPQLNYRDRAIEMTELGA